MLWVHVTSKRPIERVLHLQLWIPHPKRGLNDSLSLLAGEGDLRNQLIHGQQMDQQPFSDVLQEKDDINKLDNQTSGRVVSHAKREHETPLSLSLSLGLRKGSSVHSLSLLHHAP